MLCERVPLCRIWGAQPAHQLRGAGLGNSTRTTKALQRKKAKRDLLAVAMASYGVARGTTEIFWQSSGPLTGAGSAGG